MLIDHLKQTVGFLTLDKVNIKVVSCQVRPPSGLLHVSSCVLSLKKAVLLKYILDSHYTCINQ